MAIFDNFIDQFDSITEGLEKLFVNEDYIFVSDNDGEIICTLYNNKEGRELLDKYLEDNFLAKEDVNISIMDTLESEDVEELFKKNFLV
ncbi:MAG: hypothetical protein N4A63_00920 [Vallitalea sp.]|jgi:archaellum biogenesis ATPase FlaH|nr:hypothetical protein [Vallitalea sp.]